MAKGKIEVKRTEVILVLASEWRKPYKVLILQGKPPSPNLEKVEKVLAKGRFYLIFGELFYIEEAPIHCGKALTSVSLK